MSVDKVYYKLVKDTVLCSIKTVNIPEENKLLIECQTNFNDYLYSSTINFDNEKEKKFLKCSSSDDAIDKLIKFFYKGKVFIKEINRIQIIIGIYLENIFCVDMDNNYSETELSNNDTDILDDLHFDYIFYFSLKNSLLLNSNDHLFLNNELNNEYFHISKRNKKQYVFWREANFSKFSRGDYLQIFKIICNEVNMNLYFGSSIEKSLKYILKRKHDKIILISNIGLDLSGKRFIEIARKILGFNIIILFYSNNKNHLKWIKEFPNCLITNEISIYEKYITNYNMDGLKNLKKKIENSYNISLNNFSDDFLSYPYYENEENEENEENLSKYDINESINKYIRHVYIYCEAQNSYLCMNKDKKVSSEENGTPWDVTILDDEITLFSNGYYLDFQNNYNNIVGCEYMRIWNLEKIGENEYFFNHIKNKNNFLSIENREIKFNENKGNNQKFRLIDIPDSCNDIIDDSFISSLKNSSILSQKIKDQTGSISSNSLISIKSEISIIE